MSRLFQLIFVVCLCCPAWAGAEPNLESAGQNRELHLLCWTEYVPQKVIDGFSKQSGSKVIVENYNSNIQMLEALKAKPGYYDIIQPTGSYAETLAQTGGLEQLDLARVPNVRNLDPRLRPLGDDVGGRFSLPWMAGSVGIVVDTDRVKTPVIDWADVFDGSHAGKIVVVADGREIVAWALASLDLPITAVDDASLARVAPVLEKWLPQVRVFDSDSPSRSFLNGEVEIGIVWSGEAAILWQKDRKYQYVIPERGAHGFMDRLAIPKGAPHHALAEDFINYCLEPEVSVAISAEYPYTNPNLAARKLLSPEQLANPASYPVETRTEEIPGSNVRSGRGKFELSGESEVLGHGSRRRRERMIAPDVVVPPVVVASAAPAVRVFPSLRNVGNTTEAVEAFVRQLRAKLAKPE